MSTLPPRDQVVPEVHGCRWKWCRCTFNTYPDLVQHVLSDHVRTFVPIRRQDIAMLKRAEEGVGESLSLPDFLSSQFDNEETHNSFQSTKARPEKSRAVAPLSSLPSPPISSPTSLSTAIYDDESSYLEPSARVSLQRSQSPPNSNPQAPFTTSPSNIDETHLKFPYQRHSPPNFAFSSPTGSHADEIMINPPSPTFDSLVAKAITSNKEQNKSRFTGSSLSRPVYDCPPSSQDSSASSDNSSSESLEFFGSSGSHEFVEQQLTQSMDIDEDTNERNYSSPGGLHHQSQPTTGIISGVTNESTTPMPVRQAWYGTLPPRRSSLATPLAFGLESEMRSTTKLRAFHSTPSQSSKTTVDAIPEYVFRSGQLQISSTVNGREPTSNQPQPYSQAQSQSPSQASSLEYASYPLQTQAPYQSQSYSP